MPVRRPTMRLPDVTNRKGFSQSSALSNGKGPFSSTQIPHCTKIYHLRPQNLTPWLDIRFPECEIEADTSEKRTQSVRTSCGLRAVTAGSNRTLWLHMHKSSDKQKLFDRLYRCDSNRWCLEIWHPCSKVWQPLQWTATAVRRCGN